MIIAKYGYKHVQQRYTLETVSKYIFLTCSNTLLLLHNDQFYTIVNTNTFLLGEMILERLKMVFSPQLQLQLQLKIRIEYLK